MAPILTARAVVGQIAADCTFIYERGAVGICPNRLPPSCASPMSSSGRQPGGNKTSAKAATFAVISRARFGEQVESGPWSYGVLCSPVPTHGAGSS